MRIPIIRGVLGKIQEAQIRLITGVSSMLQQMWGRVTEFISPTVAIISCSRMCFSLRGIKYFLVGLLIYCIPGFVFWGHLFSTMPQQSTDYSNSLMNVLALLFIIGTVLAFPVIVFRIAPQIVNPMIPVGLATYFVVAYGCLVFFYRRKSQDAWLLLTLTIHHSTIQTFFP